MILNYNKYLQINESKNEYKYHPSSLLELRRCIINEQKENGPYADLNCIDVSNMKDMFGVFDHIQTIGDISNWDVSHVTRMSYMFAHANLSNVDISKWDVSKVQEMNNMFLRTEFDTDFDISNWDVSHVRDMECMFKKSNFNGDISDWNVCNVETMELMFAADKEFNGDISRWNVSRVKNMSNMFNDTKFNQDISNWKPTKLQNMEDMFYNNSEFDIKQIEKWSPYVCNKNILITTK